MSKTELIDLIKAGNLEGFKSLLDESPDLAQAHVVEMNISVLSLAIYYRRWEMVAALLEAGAEPNFWEAAALGRIDQLEAELAENPDLINQRSPDGYTPIGLAVFFSDGKASRYLIEHGADVNLVSENSMMVYPINSAAANDVHEHSMENVRILIEAGADVNAAMHRGFTPLHASAMQGTLDKAQLLLSAGADRGRKNEDGKTPADLAQEKGHAEMVALLER